MYTTGFIKINMYAKADVWFRECRCLVFVTELCDVTCYGDNSLTHWTDGIVSHLYTHVL